MMEPIHQYFCLTYAQYEVIPRSIMQSMPEVWQTRYVRLMKQFHEECRKNNIHPPVYWVTAKDNNGKYVTDPYRDYNRGRCDVFKEREESHE